MYKMFKIKYNGDKSCDLFKKNNGSVFENWSEKDG